MGIRCEREGHAAVVVLDWPEKRNAMNQDNVVELIDALISIASDTDVYGVVITGNGAFCAGGDLKHSVAIGELSEDERRTIVYSKYQNLIRTLINLPVLTVAAVDGPAIGLGFDIALACDSRFIGPNGWCMQGWSRVGFVSGVGGEWLLRLRAPDLLWRLLEEQPRIDAGMAIEWRIGEASGPMSARDRAVQRIENLSAGSRETLEAYIDVSRLDLREGLERYMDVAVRNQVKLLSSPAVSARIAQVLGKQ